MAILKQLPARQSPRHLLGQPHQIMTMTSDYAALTHNHDSDYAALTHNHDSAYASINHNHDSDYAAAVHTHNLSDITIDSALAMGSRSITGVTNLSANSLTLASGGTFTNGANAVHSGSSTFNGGIVVNDGGGSGSLNADVSITGGSLDLNETSLTVDGGSITLEHDNLATHNPTLAINALDQGSNNHDRSFTMGYNASDSRKFEIHFPKVDAAGKAKVIHQDEEGSVFLQAKGNTEGMRLVHDGTMQYGWSGSTNAGDLNGTGTNGTGVQIRHDGWTAISSGHTRGLDLNMRVTQNSDNTYPTRDAIYIRHNGSFAGSFRYNDFSNNCI